MKSYTITVNGNVYDVTVEENVQGAAPMNLRKAPVAPVVPKPSNPAPVQNAGGSGNIKIEAGAAGKVFKIEKTAGQPVKRGEAILVLEIMKMETPVVAPQDGVVVSVNVNEGQSVEAGQLLATMNE